MKSFYTIVILLFTCTLFGQDYLEEFDTANKGIMSPGCSSSDLSSCTMTDFTGVDWTMGGDLSGIDTEGFFTTGGALLTADSDVRACWISPTLNLVGASSDLSVSLSIPATSSNWDDISGSDYMEVEYSIDGGAFTIIGNVHGCANVHTVSGLGCGALTPGSNFTAVATGLTGSNIVIQVCLDSNISSEQGQINSVSLTNATPLPVELISFTAQAGEKVVQLDWRTASEFNNDYFSVERSTNGKSFSTIGRVDGAGESMLVNEYEFLDENPPASKKIYYRLRQVDHDGAFEFSPVEVVLGMRGLDFDLQVAPNPTSESLNITLPQDLNTERQLQFRVYNQLGQLVMSELISKGDGAVQLDVNNLVDGFYLLELEVNNEQYTTKFIKQ